MVKFDLIHLLGRLSKYQLHGEMVTAVESNKGREWGLGGGGERKWVFNI
jgi:hypothetical protein